MRWPRRQVDPRLEDYADEHMPILSSEDFDTVMASRPWSRSTWRRKQLRLVQVRPPRAHP